MDNLKKYVLANSTPEDFLLSSLERTTNHRAIHPRMVSGHIQGKLLEMLTRMLDPRNILEIGTFTGYSALSFAAGLNKEGIIDTIEVDDELEEIALSFFEKSPHGCKIKMHVGSALEIAPTLGKQFDLIFIDGDKREYPDYYRMIMGEAPFKVPLVKNGTYMLADNILWYGKVAEPELYKDPHTRAIIEFNEMVAADDRVENIIIPLRDGLNLIRVK